MKIVAVEQLRQDSGHTRVRVTRQLGESERFRHPRHAPEPAPGEPTFERTTEELWTDAQLQAWRNAAGGTKDLSSGEGNERG